MPVSTLDLSWRTRARADGGRVAWFRFAGEAFFIGGQEQAEEQLAERDGRGYRWVATIPFSRM